MSRPALKRPSARPTLRGKPAHASADIACSEAEALAARAAAFGLFGLRIELDETALWSNAADAYRLGTPPADPPANDVQVKPAWSFPVLTSRPYIAPTMPARFIQAIDWLVAAVAAEAAALWGADASLADLALGDAAAFLLAAGALKGGLWLTGVYRTPPARVRPEGAVGGLTLGAIMGLILAALLAPDARSAAALAAVVPAAALLLAGVHAALGVWIAAAHRAGVFSETVVLVGATETARRLALWAARSREANIVAVADDRRSRTPSRLADAPVAGSVEDMLSWEGLPYVDRIIISAPQKAEQRVRALVDRLRVLPHRIDLLLDHDVLSVRGAGIDRLGQFALARVSGRGRPAHAGAKRVLDVVTAAMLLTLFAIPMLFLAAAIRIESNGPALCGEARLGLNNRVFTLYRFRTRRLDSPQRRSHRDARAQTRFGAFLNRMRLDDLPQMFNIMRGEMSLVGPRPQSPDARVAGRELRSIADEYGHRHRVKPGLVGWSHLNGAHGPLRTTAAARRRLRLDLDYVSRASLGFDLRILAQAMWSALAHQPSPAPEQRSQPQ